jgi:hypothetical protein
MNKIPRSRNSALRGLIAVALVALGSANTWAKGHAKDTHSVEVVQNLPFDSSPTDMKLEQAGRKSFLRIHFSNAPETLLVDVTQPEKAANVAPSKLSEERSEINQSLVMVGMPAAASTRQPAGEEFVVWDISHPKHPRQVQTFTDVYRIIEDQRGYIYVLQRNGLSIVRSKDKRDNNSVPDYSIFG